MAKWIKRAVFGVLVLAILGFGADLWIGAVANSRLEKELTAIRERGEPLTLEEMAPSPLPAGEDAAPLLAEAAEHIVDLEHTDGEDESLDRFREDPFGASEEEVAVARRWIEANSRALGIIEEAAGRPGARVVGSYADPLGAKVPGMLPLVTAGHLLSARALLLARDGRPEQAFADVARTLRLAAHLERDPLLILHMVRIVIQDRALFALRGILERHPPSEADRVVLEGLLSRIDERGALRTALLGERCFGHACFERVGKEGFSFGDSALETAAPRSVFRLDQARYLELMSRTLSLLDGPWSTTRAALTEIEGDAADGPWYAIFSQVLFINVGGVVDRSMAHGALVDLARIALAIEAAGTVPGALPPGSPVDPFTGAPYRYERKDDGGFLLYSVGPDRVDDGGRDGSETGYDAGDVTWRRSRR